MKRIDKKKIVLFISILFGVIVLALTSSYALFRFNVTKNTNFKIALGTLELLITDTETEDKFILERTEPTKDEVALAGEGYTFTLKNNGTINSYYTVYLDDIILSDAGERLDNKYVKYSLLNHKTNQSITNYITSLPTDRILTKGYLDSQEEVTYTLRMWVDYYAGNDAQNKYYATQIRVVGNQANAYEYKEEILNGAEPVLTSNLIPIQIADDGTVTKANIYGEWYSYEEKRWANAVVLKTNKNYKNGEIIPESNIESYFVWIPKYSYQLWDLGNYDSLTTFEADKPHAIPIRFGLTNTSDSNVGECTTPGVAGESGNCQVGDYMTHPAFLAFDTTGLWVGKFETGYDGATSMSDAETDTNKVDTSKIIIKPNTYSWRGINVGNMFKNSYDYMRELESHMMKNTEWGAVAYLSHSLYGTCEEKNGQVTCSEVRINNNSAYITGYAGTEAPTVGISMESIDGNRNESTIAGINGIYTINYLNSQSIVASTTANYTGIYDMSGGAWEYTMGYTTGATTVGGSSEINILYQNFFTDDNWEKYYDKYSSVLKTDYNNRILGDATGELGPFFVEEDPNGVERTINSWYRDYTNFIYSASNWLPRGGNWFYGSSSGLFAFSYSSGVGDPILSYRIVLAPTK